MTVEHGTLTPADSPTSNRGNHTVEGFASVADEAARAAIIQVATDRGREVYQSAGTTPGWYRADGAGGWLFIGQVGAPPAPATHAASHENGGGDEISVAGLSGLLADAQTPAAHTVASHSDTTATGAELDTLTDGSNADALHSHAGGSGDVIGPASATDNAVARFDSTTGKLIQDTAQVTIADTGELLLKIGAGSGATAPTNADDFVLDNVGSGGMTMLAADGGTSRINFGDTSDSTRGRIRYEHSDDSMRFDANNNVEMLALEGTGFTFDSGTNVAMGTMTSESASNGSRLYLENSAAAAAANAAGWEGRLMTDVQVRSAARVQSRFVLTGDATRRGIWEVVTAASDVGASFIARGGVNGENWFFGGVSPTVANFKSMRGGVFLANGAAIPTGDPVGGGFLYSEGGALKWRGSSGTITTVAAA